MSAMSSRVWSGVLALSWLGMGGACSSSKSNVAPDDFGIVAGDVDDHCAGVTPIMVSADSCHAGPDAGAPSSDGGAAEMAPIRYNAEADDDDCKYHVKFSSTRVAVNEGVTFKVTLTKLAENGAPATNAGLDIESYLKDDDLHPVPNFSARPVESPANSGQYSLGPIKFDVSGRWVVRFHFYETCEDLLEDSPHGHVAFYYDVP